MAVIDAASGGESYDNITTDDLNNLSWESPEACMVTAAVTVIFETADGHFIKVGRFETAHTEWAVTFFYKKLVP